MHLGFQLNLQLIGNDLLIMHSAIETVNVTKGTLGWNTDMVEKIKNNFTNEQ